MTRSIVGIVLETAAGRYDSFGSSLGTLGPYTNSVMTSFDKDLFSQLGDSFLFLLDPENTKTSKIEAIEYATTLRTLAEKFAVGLYDMKQPVKYQQERDYKHIRNSIKKGHELVKKLEKSLKKWIDSFYRGKIDDKKLMSNIEKTSNKFHPKVRKLYTELFGESTNPSNQQQNPISY